MKLTIEIQDENYIINKKTQIISIPDLTKKVDSLYISVRASNCLKSAGIHTLEQLTKLRPHDLTAIPNLGKETKYDILSALYMTGYYYIGDYE